MTECLEKNLPRGKKVFAFCTCGLMVKDCARNVRHLRKRRHAGGLGNAGAPALTRLDRLLM